MPIIAIDLARDPGLRAALAEAELPTTDIGAPGRLFFCLMESGQPAAYGGLELHGEAGLLRSLVVPPAFRGRGFGRDMTLALIGEARTRGLTKLWLLTLTAADFFAKLGFERTDRSAAPAIIGASEEFATLCPATAVCMTRALTPT